MKTLGELQAGFELNGGAWKHRTYKARALAAERIVEYFGKDRMPDTIFKEDVLRFGEWLALKKNLGPKTIRQLFGVGNQWYRWMEANGEIEYNFNPFVRAMNYLD